MTINTDELNKKLQANLEKRQMIRQYQALKKKIDNNPFSPLDTAQLVEPHPEPRTVSEFINQWCAERGVAVT